MNDFKEKLNNLFMQCTEEEIDLVIKTIVVYYERYFAKDEHMNETEKSEAMKEIILELKAKYVYELSLVCGGEMNESKIICR